MGACCQIKVSSLSEKNKDALPLRNSTQLISTALKRLPMFPALYQSWCTVRTPQKYGFFKNYISKDRTNLQACQRMAIGYKMTCHHVGGLTAKGKHCTTVMFSSLVPEFFIVGCEQLTDAEKLDNFSGLDAVNKAWMIQSFLLLLLIQHGVFIVRWVPYDKTLIKPHRNWQ